MLKNNKRPVFLNITVIKFPITAIASILHRISGFFLFIITGPVLWLLKESLLSSDKFYQIRYVLLQNYYFFKFCEWLVMLTLFYHIIFGIRQILMDFGCLKQTLLIGRITVHIIFILMICLSVCIGIYIWSPLK